MVCLITIIAASESLLLYRVIPPGITFAAIQGALILLVCTHFVFELNNRLFVSSSEFIELMKKTGRENKSRFGLLAAAPFRPFTLRFGDFYSAGPETELEIHHFNAQQVVSVIEIFRSPY
jgi:hypothetical protein